MVLSIGITYSGAGAVVIPAGSVTIQLSGLAVGAIVGILLNAILPGKDYEFGTDLQGDTRRELHRALSVGAATCRPQRLPM